MKIRNVFSAIAAAAMAATVLSAIPANAADWSKASYADNDPATVDILSYTADSVTFRSTADGTTAKCRITLTDVLANAEDAAKIKSLSWKVTYDGFTPDMDPGNGVGGGTYAATTNSVSYWISPDYNDDGSAYWSTSSITVEDSAKYLLPSQVPTADGELVFMDWSNYNLVSNDIKVTVSDLKLFDENGNEIAQKTGDAPAAAPAVESAPAADTAATTSTKTGNTAAAAIAAVMAVAGTAAVVSKKRK